MPKIKNTLRVTLKAVVVDLPLSMYRYLLRRGAIEPRPGRGRPRTKDSANIDVDKPGA